MTCSVSIIQVPPKYAADIVPVLFDFSNYLVLPETIISAVVTVKTASGVDLSPINLINGAPMLNPALPLQVVQWVKAGVPGVLYLLSCQATTNAGQFITLPCLIKILIV